MPVADDLLQLVKEQEDTNGRLLNGATSALSAPLSDFRGWYDHLAITALAKLLASLLGGFEASAARSADSYMAQAISIATGKRFQPTGTRRTQLGRHGVDNESVIGRIANAYRWQQAQWDKALVESARSGKLLTVATPQDAAFDRLNRIVGTNLQMAGRSQMITTMAAADSVKGYRRIVHPELATEGTCGLCIAAADRHYKKGELLPIHPGCHCTVLPTTAKFDPQEINEADFSTLYTDAGSTSAEDLRKTRYRIDAHGEIGPVIRPEDEPIRTKRQAVGARKTPEQRTTTLEAKRQKMASELERFRSRRDELVGPEWDAVEEALAGRVAELQEAA